MARLILSDIISDIRGTVGTHTYSNWKGVHLVKNRSVNYRTAHESPAREAYNVFIAEIGQYWLGGLDQAQRDGWDDYAEYIGTLGFPYFGSNVYKIVGWKQYGGIMSGPNAFVLTNQLRRSIGKTDILEDNPELIDPPPRPIVTSATYLPGPPKTIRLTVAEPSSLEEETWLRIFCKGTRYAHLIIAKIAEVFVNGGIPWDVDYDCSVEPDAAAPAWDLLGNDFAISDGDILTIDTITPGGANACAYELGVVGLDNSVGWIVEVRLKVVTSASADERLMVNVSDGKYVEVLTFSDSLIKFLYGAGEHVMDTTSDYHIYRIVGKGASIKVFVDNVLRIDGHLSQGTAFKKVRFGDIGTVVGENSESLWDYIKIYEGGAAPPGTIDYDFDKMRYAKGAELSLQNDHYFVQCDFISISGRYSSPSDILEVDVRDMFPGGLWGSYVWNNYVWG